MALVDAAAKQNCSHPEMFSTRSCSPIVEAQSVLSDLNKLAAVANTFSAMNLEEEPHFAYAPAFGAIDLDRSWHRSPNYVSRELAIGRRDDIELTALRSREAAATEEISVLQHAIRDFERDRATNRKINRFREELVQNHEHNSIVGEYAERLQAVLHVREDQLAGLRTELQDRIGEPALPELQNLRLALHESKEVLRAETDQVAILQNEMCAAITEKRELYHKRRSHANGSLATHETSRGVESYFDASSRCSDLPSLYQQDLRHLPSFARANAQGHPPDTSAKETGSDHMPRVVNPDMFLDKLQSELFASLQRNIELEFSMYELSEEVRDVLQQESKVQETFLEETSILHNSEASAERKRSREIENDRIILQHSEKAWKDEANIAKALRADLDANVVAIANLTQTVREGVKELVVNEEAAAIQEQRSQALKVELRMQSATSELLRSELHHNSSSIPQVSENLKFEEHVQEVREIATSFRTELFCVARARGAVVQRESSSTPSRMVSEELEMMAASVNKRASTLHEELELRDKEISRIRAKLRNGDSKHAFCEGVESVVGKSVVRSTTPSRSTTPPPTPPRCMRRTSPRRTGTTPPASFRLALREKTVDVTSPVVHARSFASVPLPMPTPLFDSPAFVQDRLGRRLGVPRSLR